jgi:hypothetical protein
MKISSPSGELNQNFCIQYKSSTTTANFNYTHGGVSIEEAL